MIWKRVKRNSDLITQLGGFTSYEIIAVVTVRKTAVSSSRQNPHMKEGIGHDISPLDKALSATDSCWHWESQLSLKL